MFCLPCVLCGCRAYSICKVWELKTGCLRYVIALNPQMWERIIKIYRCAIAGRRLRHVSMLAYRPSLTVLWQGANGADDAASAH